jgi:hypothetical protein
MTRFASAVIVLLACGLATLSAQITTSSVESTRSISAVLGIPATSSGKCGTSDLMFAYLHWNELSLQKKSAIQKITSRPEKQKDRLSRSGRFRIHYDTAGTGSPALITFGPNSQRIPNTVEQYVDSLEAALEYAWRLEVDTLGFLPPPSDGGQGGGPEYDVYVSELGTDLFGRTLWSDVDDIIISGVRRTFSSYIEIENDFLGFRTPGMDGLRITTAHEFHHAIQVGNYGYWTNLPNYDFYFYELTSVWMEHVAYANIKDYYYDLPNYLERFRDSQNRSYTFTTYTGGYAGYERSIWAQYLAKRFGRDIMRQVWTGMVADPVLVSTGKILQQYGTSLESEFTEFSDWNYFTSDRAQAGKYYDDAADWPRFLPNVASTFGGLSSSISSSGWPLSTQFCQFAISGDTVTAILTNVDATDAVDPSASATGYQLQLSASNPPRPYQKVTGGLSLSFLPVDKSKWKTICFQSSTRSIATVASDPFPNPISVSRNSRLSLPLAGSTEKRSVVYFLNAALELIMSREYEVTESFGSRYVFVPSSDLRERTPSGVYFVKATCGDREYQWKVAIVQ